MVLKVECMVTLLWLMVTTDMVLGLIMPRSMTLSILYGNIDLLCGDNILLG